MEKETVFSGSDYNGLKKVYSVWICLDAPLKMANKVIRYGMSELCPADETHGVHQTGAAYDLLEVMLFCLNEKSKDGGGPVMEMLRTLFSLALSQEEKHKILKEKYSITFNQEERKMLTVADYIEYVKEKCEERAEDKIKKTVVTNMLRRGMSEKEIQGMLGITTKEARELIHDVQTNVQN